VTIGVSFCATAKWEARDQSPADVAARWLHLVERLRALDPVFSYWFTPDRDYNLVPLALNPSAVAAAIKAGVGRDEDGREEPRYGHRLSAINSSADRSGPRDVQLSLLADWNSRYANNFVSLTTFYYGVVPDPELVTFRIFREVVLAMSEAFDASSAKAYHSGLIDTWPQGRDAVDLPPTWISYLGPAYAHLVTPPPTAIVERRPDGGLLLAATDETFDTENPTHMAVAHDIARAVAPFNALPRPLGWPAP
jgi:hypothetical protein